MALHAGATAVIDGERRVSYGELARRVNALGNLAAGRIGFLGANSLAHMECWLGVPAAARCRRPRLPAAPEELVFLVRDAGSNC